uniref:Solute carrier family 43 member 2 n=1 Tax=Latimeria chalumnae TaxID=7897 RepID=H3AQD8_LATCH
SQPRLSSCRRRWIISTTLIETLFFSGVVFGWHSLLPMLKSEGIYSLLCNQSENIPHCVMSETKMPLHTHTQEKNSWPTCEKQEAMLNLGFTMGSFCLGFTLLPLQVVMEMAHLRRIRMIGSFCFLVRCDAVIWGWGAGRGLSMFMLFALVCYGIGGACILFTSLLLPMLLGKINPLYGALVLGCYVASTVVFTVLRAIYTSGIPFIPVILVYGGISCLTFINCFFSWSVGTDTAGKENSYRLKHKDSYFLGYERNLNAKKFHFSILFCCQIKTVSTKGEACRGTQLAKEGHNLNIETQNLKILFYPSSIARHDLNQSLLSPVFILNLSIAMVTQVWTHFYMGSFHTWLQQLSKDKYKTVDMLSYVFGTLQMLSLLSAPAVSLLLGSNLETCSECPNAEMPKMPDPSQVPRGKYRIKQVGTLKNLILTFTLNSLLLTAFGVVSLIPHLELQVLGFLLYALVRGSMFICTCTLYEALFPANHFGALLGFHTLFSMGPSLLQHPLYLLITRDLQDNPFWIYVALLALSLVGFSIPLYLHRLQTKILERRQSPRHNTDVGGASSAHSRS